MVRIPSRCSRHEMKLAYSRVVTADMVRSHWIPTTSWRQNQQEHLLMERRWEVRERVRSQRVTGRLIATH